MTQRLHVIIQGRVQGVNFRYAAHDQAGRLGLRGWVRNLPDGRVEAEFEGSKAGLEAILHWCRHGPACARVDTVEEHWDSGEPKYDRFRVRF